MEGRLEAVTGEGGGGCAEERCEKSPQPVSDPAPHQPPETRACARSCLQLRDQGGSPQDGVYWLTGLPVPAMCDFSHDGGGWTLLLTAVSHQGWDLLSVLGRGQRAPSLTSDYSILGHADSLRDLGSGSRFAYRLEAQAQTARRRWGGVWLAPRNYTFVLTAPTQTGVTLFRRFDNWAYNNSGIEQRMPWLNSGDEPGLLSTSESFTTEWWGTLVSQREAEYQYQHSPWMYPDVYNSGTVLYWMREEMA